MWQKKHKFDIFSHIPIYVFFILGIQVLHTTVFVMIRKKKYITSFVFEIEKLICMQSTHFCLSPPIMEILAFLKRKLHWLTLQMMSKGPQQVFYRACFVCFSQQYYSIHKNNFFLSKLSKRCGDLWPWPLTPQLPQNVWMTINLMVHYLTLAIKSVFKHIIHFHEVAYTCNVKPTAYD